MNSVRIEAKELSCCGWVQGTNRFIAVENFDGIVIIEIASVFGGSLGIAGKAGIMVWGKFNARCVARGSSLLS